MKNAAGRDSGDAGFGYGTAKAPASCWQFSAFNFLFLLQAMFTEAPRQTIHDTASPCLQLAGALHNCTLQRPASRPLAQRYEIIC